MCNRSKHSNDKIKNTMYSYKIQQRIAYIIHVAIYAIIQGGTNVDLQV